MNNLKYLETRMCDKLFALNTAKVALSLLMFIFPVFQQTQSSVSFKHALITGKVCDDFFIYFFLYCIDSNNLFRSLRNIIVTRFDVTIYILLFGENLYTLRALKINELGQSMIQWIIFEDLLWYWLTLDFHQLNHIFQLYLFLLQCLFLF